MQTAQNEELYDQLSGNYHGHFIRASDSFRCGRKSGEKEGTVGIYQTERCPALYQIKIRHYGKFDESSGKRGQKNIGGSI